MKQLTPEQLQHAANILWALDHAEPLEILQYVGSQEDPPTYQQIAEAIGISDSLVKYNVSRLEQEGILAILSVPTFEDPEAGLVQMKELSEMPTLAQAIILELWPDWYGKEEVKPEPLLIDMSHVNWQPVIDVSASPLGLGLARNEEEGKALDRACRLGYNTMRYMYIVGQPNKIQVRTGFSIDSVSETWIDLEDPEAVWNAVQQVE